MHRPGGGRSVIADGASGRVDGHRVVDMSPAIDQVTTERVGRKLFVGNLLFNTTPDELREHFEQFGRVIDVQTRRDRNHMPSFGFVTFEKEDDARAALAAKANILDGRALTLAIARQQ